MALNVVVSESMIKTAQMSEPTAFDMIKRCEGGHFLMLSCPEWTVMSAEEKVS